MNILVINAGSSSLKYQLMNPETGDVAAKGLCERIGIDGRLTHKTADKKIEKEIAMPTHGEAIAAVMAALLDAEHGVIKSVSEIDAVGHRVLHGGMKFSESCIINDTVIATIVCLTKNSWDSCEYALQNFTNYDISKRLHVSTR